MNPFVSGTSVFGHGPFKESSDIDIVMMEYDAIVFRAKLEKGGFEIRQTPKMKDLTYTGFIFSIAERNVNVIILETRKEYDDWFRATEIMKNEPPIHNKEKRVAKFQYYRNNS